MKLLPSRYIRRRRREIADERDEATMAIAAMIPDIDYIAAHGKTEETRRLAREWLELVTPEEREIAETMKGKVRKEMVR